MSAFKSYSQCGQDVFAYFVCGTDKGTFLDIGASNPTSNNNSYGLELKGWSGITIDNSPEYAKHYVGVRKAPLTVVDMTAVNWDDFIAENPILQSVVNYLSFDIDEASLPVLRKFPFERMQFQAVTVEHDAYRLGDPVRQEMRKIFRNAGYELIAADVVVYYLWKECPEAVALKGYLPFEDWYVKPDLVDMGIANGFRSDNKLWNEILASCLRGSRNVWAPL